MKVSSALKTMGAKWLYTRAEVDEDRMKEREREKRQVICRNAEVLNRIFPWYSQNLWHCVPPEKLNC